MAQTNNLSMEARLCVDFSEKTCFEAFDILHEAGFRISTLPVSGLLGPELYIGNEEYHGIDEIKNFVKRVEESKAWLFYLES